MHVDVMFFLYQRRRAWRVEDKASAAGHMTPLLRVKFEARKVKCSQLILKSANLLVSDPGERIFNP